MKINYILIPLIVFFVGFGGGRLTRTPDAMQWYQTLTLPSWTPPGSFIGLVWTVIFILTAVSLIIVWNRIPRIPHFSTIIAFFIANGVFNVLWSFLFFNRHLLTWAFFDALLIGLTVYVLIFLIWPYSKSAALLLFPYAGWVTFASFLNYQIMMLNR